MKQDDGWRLPDELWAKMQPLLPPRPPHPLGCNPRVDDRRAMDAILLVLRTGMQWHAFPGFNRFRRLLVRWEKREDTYLAMLHFALGSITWFHALLPK